MFFVKTHIFEQEIDFRFEMVNEEYEYIHDMADGANLFIKTDNLEDHTISTFFKLCNKMEDDIQNYARICVLKVESLDVDFYDGNGDNKRKSFDGYCICVYSEIKIYMVDKKECNAYKMMT